MKSSSSSGNVIFFEPHHEGFVQSLGVQTNEEETVRRAGRRLPHTFEGVLVYERRALRFDSFVFLVLPYLKGKEAGGVHATRCAHQCQLLYTEDG